MIRLLERRMLLDAVLSDHLLTVTGTSQADMIRLQIANSRLVVFVNSGRSSFPLQSVKRINVVGGSGNDHIELSEIAKPATVNAGAGDDSVFGGQSADLLLGRDGRDYLDGGAGNDRLDGGAGRDVLLGNGGSDTADYSSRTTGVTISLDDLANDGANGERDNVGGDIECIVGTSGNDLIRGSDQAAIIHGAAGNDTIMGGYGDDRLYGDGGNDSLDGGAGTNSLVGGDGNDKLMATSGWADSLIGGKGDDVFDMRDSWAGDFADGGDGRDIAYLDKVRDDDGVRTDQARRVEHLSWSEHDYRTPDGPDYPMPCFLTTAVVAWAGKADDCEELTLLRRFRDTYMRGLPRGPDMIRDYYWYAPHVVRAIQTAGLGQVEWPRVLRMVYTAIRQIRAGRNAEALATYAAEYLRLKARYVRTVPLSTRGGIRL